MTAEPAVMVEPELSTQNVRFEMETMQNHDMSFTNARNGTKVSVILWTAVYV